MPTIEKLLPWVKRLTGLDPDRSRAALDELRSWQVQPAERVLLATPDLDTLVAAVLLAESVRDLSAQGVKKEALLEKLNAAEAPDQFWAVWAEVRSAAILIGHPDYPARLTMAQAGDDGPQFRLQFPDGGSVEIVFRPVAFSDREADWHRRANQQFDALLPPVGLANLHGRLDQPIRVSRSNRDRAWKKSRLLARQLRTAYPAWANLRGIAIVAQEAEADYLTSVRQQIEESLEGLPTDRECWVGLWWGNAAPAHATARLLDEVNAPAHVLGLVFIGQAIAVPWSEINVFILGIDRGAGIDAVEVDSAVDDELAGLVLNRFERSSGLRPTMLRTPGRNGITLLRRDGTRRIFPFNLLFDPDPPEAAGRLGPAVP